MRSETAGRMRRRCVELRRPLVFQARNVSGGPRGTSGEESMGESETDSSHARDRPMTRPDFGTSRETDWTSTSCGGVTLHFCGGESKPRFNVTGEGVDP
jgi:hypothetical protein